MPHQKQMWNQILVDVGRGAARGAPCQEEMDALFAPGELTEPRIGLDPKPDCDDLRESLLLPPWLRLALLSAR